MADEVTDPHGNQILSVCLRMLDDCKVKQFFFDFIYIETATGEAIAHDVIECLKDRNIGISKARGQNYDGAQCKSSNKVGVQARIKELSTRALYIHCSSHVLNLSISNVYRLPATRNMIDTLNAIFLFFDMSPKRQLERILKHLAPDMRKRKLVGMYKTRWVERHVCYDTFYDMDKFLCECLEAILNPSEYHDIDEEVALTSSWDEETRTKAQGLLTSLTSSRAIIAFIITTNVLENVRPKASKLQKRELDIYQAYSMIDQTRERMITTRQEIEEENSVWYKDATCLATLLCTSISAPG